MRAKLSAESQLMVIEPLESRVPDTVTFLALKVYLLERDKEIKRDDVATDGLNALKHVETCGSAYRKGGESDFNFW